ncbi:MAG: histidinol dehydrogenase [Bacteroidota bacterium]
MKVYQNPPRSMWAEITQRPLMDFSEIESRVSAVMGAVRKEGDEALRRFTKQFDKVELDTLEVSKEEIEAASVSPELAAAIHHALENIRRFHEHQLEEPKRIQVREGVTCWRKSVGIEKVGLYIPGGTAPLISTVLMLAIPASIAGCKEIILCSPPTHHGSIHEGILYAAKVAGVHRVFKVGGAQAVAAMGYGTDTIPKVDKIFGPGNQYVTTAKQLLSKEGTAIDMPAGPSELAVVADEQAEPDFVAADLLSQAEHGVDSQVLLITTSSDMLERVQKAVREQVATLPRREIAEKALQNSRAVLFDEFNTALDFTNAYAAEHLILAVADVERIAEKITQAGSVFMGNHTPESAGDYASGTNHTLPTNGFARAYSGVSVDSFVRKITFQQLTPEGLETIGDAVEEIARAESLEAHRRAISIRRERVM